MSNEISLKYSPRRCTGFEEEHRKAFKYADLFTDLFVGFFAKKKKPKRSVSKPGWIHRLIALLIQNIHSTTQHYF